MSNTRFLHALLITSLLLGGCYKPDLSGKGQFNCPDEKCPSGFVCNSEHVCERRGQPPSDTGVVADASGDAQPDAGPTLSCEAEDAVPISEPSEVFPNRIGLALDDVENALYVSYPAVLTTRRLYYSKLDLDGPTQWQANEIEDFGSGHPTTVATDTAVAATDGNLAVVFNKPGTDYDHPWLVKKAKTDSAHDTIGLTSASGVLAHFSVRFLPTSPGSTPTTRRLVVAGQGPGPTLADPHRPHVFGVDFDNGVASGTHMATPHAAFSVFDGGLFNRLTVSLVPSQPLRRRIALASVATDSTVIPGGRTSQVLFGSWLVGDVITAPSGQQPVGQSVQNLPLDTLGIGLIATPDSQLVYPQSPPAPNTAGGSHLVLQSPPNEPTEVALRDVPPQIGAPSLTFRGGFLGLAFTDGGGAVWVTARDAAENGPWLPPLHLAETGDTERVSQVEVIASDTTDQGVIVLEVVYLRHSESQPGNKEMQVLYREVRCQL